MIWFDLVLLCYLPGMSGAKVWWNHCMVGEKSNKKTKKSNMEDHNPFLKSSILNMKSERLWYSDLYQTYVKYKQGQQVIFKQVCLSICFVKYVFWLELVIPKYHSSCLNGLIFIFSLIESSMILGAVFMSILMVLNSKIYKSKYQILFGE